MIKARRTTFFSTNLSKFLMGRLLNIEDDFWNLRGWGISGLD
jgi:hypothetical protein